MPKVSDNIRKKIIKFNEGKLTELELQRLQIDLLAEGLMGSTFIDLVEEYRWRKEHSPLVSISFKDFIELDIPPLRWVIDRIIPYSGITALSAPLARIKRGLRSI